MQRTLTVTLLASIIFFATGSTAFSKETNPKENSDGDTQQFEKFQEPKTKSLKEPGGMSLEKLTSIIKNVGRNVEIQDNGSIAFTFDNAQLIAVVSEPANRMRILSPVIDANDLTETQMAAMLVSNYHLALDARYAVGQGVLYSVFIHPLKELTDDQLLSAIRQVATLRNTFGTSYSSGEMSFGVQTEERLDT